MPQLHFDPPLTVKGNIVVRNIDDAVRFMVGHQEARHALYRRASFTLGEAEERDAGYAFPRLGRRGASNRQI
jgi:hypothetical protein